MSLSVFFFQAEDGIRDGHVTGVQTCALPISPRCRRRNDRVPLRPMPGEAAASDLCPQVRGTGEAFDQRGGAHLCPLPPRPRRLLRRRPGGPTRRPRPHVPPRPTPASGPSVTSWPTPCTVRCACSPTANAPCAVRGANTSTSR